uniref:PPCK4 n=1 Tax=Arundo donax TaxID=35708 RepID=A0A0A9H3W3_ARUDO
MDKTRRGVFTPYLYDNTRFDSKVLWFDMDSGWLHHFSGSPSALDPRVPEYLLGGEPSRNVAAQHPPHQVLGRRRHPGEQPGREPGATPQH